MYVFRLLLSIFGTLAHFRVRVFSGGCCKTTRYTQHHRHEFGLDGKHLIGGLRGIDYHCECSNSFLFDTETDPSLRAQCRSLLHILPTSGARHLVTHSPPRASPLGPISPLLLPRLEACYVASCTLMVAPTLARRTRSQPRGRGMSCPYIAAEKRLEIMDMIHNTLLNPYAAQAVHNHLTSVHTREGRRSRVLDVGTVIINTSHCTTS